MSKLIPHSAPYSGRPSIEDFWFHHDDHCKHEIPQWLKDFYDRMPDNPKVVFNYRKARYEVFGGY